MRITLSFLIFASLFVSSCKQNNTEDFYIDALKFNNSLIIDNTNLRLNFFERYSQTDPRAETQRIKTDMYFIHTAVEDILFKMKNLSGLGLSKKVNEFKLYLIRNYAPKGDTLNFKEKYKVQKVISQEVPEMVLVNEILLLENELIYYLSGQLRMYDYKIDIKQAIFKINEKQYFALMMVWPGETELDSIKITTVQHNDIILGENEYTMQYENGFLGVVLNLQDTTDNKFGGYYIGYEVYHKNISNYLYPMSNYFHIEE